MRSSNRSWSKIAAGGEYSAASGSLPFLGRMPIMNGILLIVQEAGSFMTMVVECDSCRSRFRLNESLLKESKAVRFRCRRCGGFITVRNPHAAPFIPDSAVPEKNADAPLEGDVPYWIPSDPEPQIPRGTPVPPLTVHRLDDLVVFSPGKDAGPQRVSTRRKPSPGRNILVAGMSVLLLAGGVLYFGATVGEQELLGKWFPSWGSAPQANPAARPAYDVREAKFTVHEQAVAGHLFVVSGTVVNIGKGISRGIQVRTALLGEDHQVLMENSSIAGNLIDEAGLLHMNRNPIEADLKTEYKEGGERRDIPPGTSLPFMVVFFDPPGKIGSFTVHAVDAD